MFRQNRTPKRVTSCGNSFCRAAILAANITNGGLRVDHLQRRLASVQHSRDSPIRLNRGHSHQTMNLLECGGKRSATPLSSGSQASRITWRPGGSHQVGKSAVAASLCRSSPKKCDKKTSPNRFRRQLANDVPQNPANASKEIIVLKSAR